MATVLIIGRPNVGKSTLFNRLVGGRDAIVDNLEGLTRDFKIGKVRWYEKSFDLIDTCGLFDNPKDIIEEKMKEVTFNLINEGDLILYLVDGKNGLVGSDQEFAEKIRKSGKEVILVANKVENEDKYKEEHELDLYSLGLGEPFPISAVHGINKHELLEIITDKLEKRGFDLEDSDESESIKIAIVGKPNAGKSSIFNKIIKNERSLVTEIAGTTRDTVNERIKINENEYIFIDTAGIRKKSKVKIKNVEYYSVMRAVTAIQKSDIVVMVIDATEGIGSQDQKIAGIIENSGKGVIVVYNKSDLINEKERKELIEEFEMQFYFINYSPVLFVSALNGTGIRKIIDSIELVRENIQKKIPTGILNNVVSRYTLSTPPVGNGRKKAKIYYSTQISTKPPVIGLFVNDPGLFNESYLRGLRKMIRTNIDPFTGSPIYLKLKRKKK